MPRQPTQAAGSNLSSTPLKEHSTFWRSRWPYIPPTLCTGYRAQGRQAQYPASAVLLGAAAFAVLFVILLERRGGYRIGHSLLAVRETERILRVTMESFLLALFFSYFSGLALSRLVIAFTAITVPIFVMLEKWEAYHGMRILREKASEQDERSSWGPERWADVSTRRSSALLSLGSIRWPSWMTIRKSTAWKSTNRPTSTDIP